jgi:antitoxin PrlF
VSGRAGDVADGGTPPYDEVRMAKRSKEAATVTSKGQITLPKSVRERLGVRAGDRVRFREIADGTVVVEAETGDLMELFGALVPAHGRSVTLDDMDDAIRRAAARSGSGK